MSSVTGADPVLQKTEYFVEDDDERDEKRLKKSSPNSTAAVMLRLITELTSGIMSAITKPHKPV